jgi:ribosomal protein S18 acetylase RimI-like enzyme
MAVQLRPASASDTEAIVRLSLRAWAPVFASLRETLGASAYAIVYPDWERQQRETVERACGDAGRTIVWAAETDGTIAGFVAYTLDAETKLGTVELLAVDPEYQYRGTGTALNRLALDRMREAGMRLAGLSTGGDPGHAPARRAYEKAGYRAFPNVWYFQEL